MMHFRLHSVIVAMVVGIFSGMPIWGQQILNDNYLNSMKYDMRILTADSLEGREAGSMGELHAALFIAERFETMSIDPYFGICYYQDFSFDDGKEYGSDRNYIKITDTKRGKQNIDDFVLKGVDMMPMMWGGEGVVRAQAIDMGYFIPKKKEEKAKSLFRKQKPNISGKIVIAIYDKPAHCYTLESVTNLMAAKVKSAEEAGAAGVIFYDPSGELKIAPGKYFIYDKYNIPVVFVYNPADALKLKNKEVEISVESNDVKSFGKNVAGWIDNGAEKTIVIGAHYDHLGMGYYTSRHDGTPAIHYGADDNASGVVGMLALAEWLAASDLKNYNYLFIAFSAEEKGLLGSRFFTSEEEFDPEKYLCMFNFDMIGRVDIENPKLSLLGSGSSPVWEKIITEVHDDFEVEAVPGGTNGSDHYHFYENKIPVLFFFTGMHDDYHKPSDRMEKINFNGIRDVVEYSIGLLSIVDTIKNIPFSKMPEINHGTTGRGGKISLGIVPDHATATDGIKVQDVLPNRPAVKAGVEKGDIIVNLNNAEVHNITDYMKALKTINEGDKVKVIVMRNGAKMQFTLKF